METWNGPALAQLEFGIDDEVHCVLYLVSCVFCSLFLIPPSGDGMFTLRPGQVADSSQLDFGYLI